MSRRLRIHRCKLVAATLVVSALAATPARGQTWIGATGDWNTPSNWTPAVVPNSAAATAAFTGAGVASVNISASVQAQTVAFLGGGYTLNSSANQTLSGVSSIIIGPTVSGLQTVNLANVATGSLLYTGAFTVNNLSSPGATRLVIGANTVIGAPAHGGLTFTGIGITQLSGAFASTNNVTGGLTKSGSGTLIFSGSGANLTGGLTLAGGTLELNYSANSAIKFGGGGLTLGGGQLTLVANTAVSVFQSASNTVVNAGHTDVVAVSSGGGTITLGAGAVTRTAGGTLDVSTGTGSPNFTVTTPTGNTNGLLGAGPAFATVGGGLTWAVASGGGFAGLSAGGYGVNVFTTGTNVDVTTSSSPAAFTANSLRFNTVSPTLTLTGTNTLQSGGVLVTPSATGGTITGGGTLAAAGATDLVVHQYSTAAFTINANVTASGGLTKTGPGTLVLGGTNTGLIGPVNVNRGDLTVTNLAAVNSASQISFNDLRTGNSQTFTVDVGNNLTPTLSPPVRVAAVTGGSNATLFTTGASTGTHVILAGTISSAAGETPLRFSGVATNSSGFILTNPANSFLGDLTVVHGTLGVLSDASLSDPANALILSLNDATAGGLEILSVNQTYPRAITVATTSRVVADSGTNTLSGAISGTGTLVKAGIGTLVLAGTGSGLSGGLALSAGTLTLDYSTSTASKTGGGLTLNGGVFKVVANTATPVTQSITGGTAVAAGHTDVTATSAGGGTITLGLGAITRSAGATIDVVAGSGAPTFTATTSTGNTNSLLGTGPAFATVNNGATWATASGGNIAGLASYTTGSFTATANVDVTAAASVGPGTAANSLRFNTGSQTLTINGSLTIQSGGILVTTGNVGGSIVGAGTLTAGSGELIVHQYDAASFPITVSLTGTTSLTKTGPGTLVLGGNNPGLTGAVNVNRGHLTVTTAAAVGSAGQINFNDYRGSVSNQQVFTVDVGNAVNATLPAAIRLSAGTGTQFSTGNSGNSRITLGGVLSTPAGLSTHVLFDGGLDTSGFNLTAANTFTGTVQVLHGFLGITSDAGLGDAANILDLHLNNTAAGGLEFLSSGTTVNRAVSLADTRIISNGTDSNTISGVFSGGGQFVKAGTGTLTLPNANNTFGGSTATITVAAGTLSFGVNGAVGDGTDLVVNAGATFIPSLNSFPTFGTVTLNGGTYRAQGGIQVSAKVQNVVVTSAGGTVDYSAATGTPSVSFPAGSAGITIQGDSTWLGQATGAARLLGPVSAEIPITISPGVTFTNGFALTTSGSFGYRVTGGGTLFGNVNAAGISFITAPLTIVGSRFRLVDASTNGTGNFGTGTFTLDGGTFAYGGATAATSKSIAVTANGGTIDIESPSAALTANGLINGTGSLTKVGPGTLVLANSIGTSFSLTVTAGTVQTAFDIALGSNPMIPVGPAGTLRYANAPTTSRTFNLNFGTLAAASGAVVTLNGAAVNGGFMAGPGTFLVTGGTTLSGVTTFGSTVINQTGAATFTNFTSGGQLTLAAALANPAAFTRFTNQGSGSITVGAATQVNATDFQSYGVLTLAPTAGPTFTQLTNVGSTPLFFNGGSRTFIGSPATAGGGAGIDLKGSNAVVAGGLFVNNGYVTDSAAGAPGRVVADFGALVKGAGFYQSPVVTQNGGRFQAGNSPGKVTFGSFTFGPGGVNDYVFAINDATGSAGPAPDAAGQVSGWGLVQSVALSVGSTTNTGDFAWTADPAHKLTVALETLVNPATVGTDVAGPMAHFDPTQAYAWPAVTWAGAYTGPVEGSALATATTFDTAGFLNPTAGTFGWNLDTAANTLSLTYTPVPEPATLALAGLAAIGMAWRRARSRRFAVAAVALAAAPAWAQPIPRRITSLS